MIKSAEEFKRLRTSQIAEEQRRSALEAADDKIWLDVIQKYPELKVWVVRNKTIPIEILELLSTDIDERVRYEVARKRKINLKIFTKLKDDLDESVRHGLLCNTKLSIEFKKQVKVDDSDWLKKELNEIIKN